VLSCRSLSSFPSQLFNERVKCMYECTLYHCIEKNETWQGPDHGLEQMHTLVIRQCCQLRSVGPRYIVPTRGLCSFALAAVQFVDFELRNVTFQSFLSPQHLTAVRCCTNIITEKECGAQELPPKLAQSQCHLHTHTPQRHAHTHKHTHTPCHQNNARGRR
jgi:hypothetical protein